MLTKCSKHAARKCYWCFDRGKQCDGAQLSLMKWEEWELADAIRTGTDTRSEYRQQQHWRMKNDSYRSESSLFRASVRFGGIILQNKGEWSWMAKPWPSLLFSAAASDGTAAASTRWERETDWDWGARDTDQRARVHSELPPLNSSCEFW